MCEYCGCRGVEAVAELLDEHDALLDRSHDVRTALAAGDRDHAAELLGELVTHLDVHVRREEDGIFTALRLDGEYVAEVEALEQEHADLDLAVQALDPGDPAFESHVDRMLEDLREHIERENVGIFPVSVVSLGAEGWDIVHRARHRFPSFLADRVTA